MEDTPRAEFARGEHKPVASAAKARSRDELAHPASDCRSSVSVSLSLSLEREIVWGMLSRISLETQLAGTPVAVVG